MSAFHIDKVVSSLPAVLQPSTVYAVRTGTGFDLYVSDSTGSVAHSLNLPEEVKYISDTPPDPSEHTDWFTLDGQHFIWDGSVWFGVINGGGSVGWESILDKPLTFPPEAHSHDVATTTVAGFMSSADKTKLDGVASGAEANVNADWEAVSGDALILNKPVLGTAAAASSSDFAAAAHVGSGGSSHSEASTTVAGFMSPADKTKLDGVAANANNYAHPDHTGEVTSAADGTTTIAAGVVTNAKLANVPTATIKGRVAAGTGSAQDLTPAEARSVLGLASVASSGSASDLSSGTLPADRFDDTAHGTRSGGSLHSLVTTSVAGFMSSADKTKLDGIASGATANSPDATLLDRANHTGTQAQSTVTGLVVDLALKAPLASPTFSGTVTLPAGQSVNGVVLSTSAGTGVFLRGDGTYAAPAGGSGSGDVVGPASSVADSLALFDGTTGKLLKSSSVSVTDNGSLVLPENSSPTPAAAGTLKLFVREIANRLLPAFVGPSGLDSTLQPLLARNKVGYWCPPGNATTVPGVLGFTAPTVTGFTATARNVATTNLFTRMRRLGYVTAATAGAVGQWRQGSGQFTVGSSSTNLGGFTYIVRFGISDAADVAGARMFKGLRTVATPSNVEPSTLTNCIGIGHGAIDTTMRLYYGGSAAQPPIDLGANFPCNTRNTDVYELALFSSPSSGDVHWEVTRLNTGHVATGTIVNTGAAVLPTNTTLLCAWGYRTNNATALAVGLDVMSAYLETDL